MELHCFRYVIWRRETSLHQSKLRPWC